MFNSIGNGDNNGITDQPFISGSSLHKSKQTKNITFKRLISIGMNISSSQQRKLF